MEKGISANQVSLLGLDMCATADEIDHKLFIKSRTSTNVPIPSTITTSNNNRSTPFMGQREK